MARKSGLGKKGLDVLITDRYKVEKEAENDDLSTSVDKLVDKPVKNDNDKPDKILKISLIEPNRSQPRRNFDEDSLADLAESIRQYGILQPLLVVPRDSHYEIIAGERRWRAAKLAGLKEVPVIIREYTDQEIMEISLIENIQREDLNPIEEAQAYQRLIQEFHMTQEELSQKISRSRTSISNRIRLLRLTPGVQKMLADGSISEGHARALLPLEAAELQEIAAEQILDEDLSVRDTEKLVKKMLTPPVDPKPVPEGQEQNRIIYEKLEEELCARMGTKVSIKRRNAEKGRIQIDYYSLEELERLVEFLRRV